MLQVITPEEGEAGKSGSEVKLKMAFSSEITYLIVVKELSKQDPLERHR